jgi:hypothetical protein
LFEPGSHPACQSRRPERSQLVLARRGLSQRCPFRKFHPVITTIGIDIGKNTFHLVGLDKRGAIVLQQKVSRGQLERRLANIPRCLIGMEACSGAHHMGRQLAAVRHDVRLIPAQYVELKSNFLPNSLGSDANAQGGRSFRSFAP